MISYMEMLVKSTNFNQNLPLTEIVYESLREAIISGIIPLGERIVEKEYAKRLNISRTPIRAALKMLESEEILEHIPKIGMVVKEISADDVVEVFNIRQNLEVSAITVAMDNITKEEIMEIEELMELTEQENRNGNSEEVIRLFGEFNSKIYKASRMKRLDAMIGRMDEYLKRFRNISMAEYNRREQAIKEHREILMAIVEKNKKDISSIVEKHLEDSLKIVIEEIEECRK